MGARGPIPERKENLLGHRAKDELEGGTVTRIRIPTKVSQPQADKNWHPIATRLYNSVKISGQTRYYEPSDWAILYFVCDELTHYMGPGKRSAQKLVAINQLMLQLLLTEGERRRVGMEIDREPEGPSIEDEADQFYDEIL